MGELLNLVELSTGVVLYAMLFTMVVRARKMQAADGSLDRLPLATAILGLAWNVCAIPIYELPNVGIRGPLPCLSVIDVPFALRSARVPPLIVLPLLENAIKHGVAPNRVGGDVLIRARVDRTREDRYELVVTVKDTGTGTTAAALQRGRERGLGLRNVERRLACQYGTEAALSVRSSPGHSTTAEIRLPVAVWIEEPAARVGA